MTERASTWDDVTIVVTHEGRGIHPGHEHLGERDCYDVVITNGTDAPYQETISGPLDRPDGFDDAWRSVYQMLHPDTETPNLPEWLTTWATAHEDDLGEAIRSVSGT